MRLLYQKGLLCGDDKLRCNQSLQEESPREERWGVRGAIRTEETADNSLTVGAAYLVTHSQHRRTGIHRRPLMPSYTVNMWKMQTYTHSYERLEYQPTTAGTQSHLSPNFTATISSKHSSTST